MKKEKKTKTTLITGTTSGIGFELSDKFAKEGFNLVLVSRNEQKLKTQKEDLEKRHKIKAHYICKDLSSPKAPEEIFSDTRENKIHIDVLINNAGFNESGLFHETSLQKELQLLQVHIASTTHLTKLFLPPMMENKYGKIMNLGSVGSFCPCPIDAVYCAAKAYVLNFSSALRSELLGTGVSVSTLCPGPTDTEFAKKAGMENALAFRKLTMRPEQVAEAAYKGLMRNKKIIIPGLFNRLLVLSTPFTPSSVLDKITIALLKKS